MNVILKNAQIVTQNARREVFTGDILIEGKVIKEVAPRIDRPGVPAVDLSGLTVVPGFVQAHIHLCQALFRNLADDLELLDWLAHYVWPMEQAHTPASLRASARLGLYEILRSGVTTILDMGAAHHMDVVFEELERSGIRAFCGKVMMDAGEQPYKEPTGEVLASVERQIRRWHGAAEGRIHYALAPRFVLTCSDTLWDAVAALSREYNLLIHTHSSENRKELQLVREQTGYDNVEFFVQKGLASPRLCLAHCIWLEDREVDYLAEYGIHVLHCPAANLKLGSGFAPIPRYLSRNINVALGSDGAPCNNNLDIFVDMRLAALIHKPRFGVTAINAQQILDMATLGGAKAVGMEDQIGSIEPGKLADLAVLDLRKVHLTPADNVVSQIVYSAQSRDVVHVMVNGNWVVQEGKPVAYSEEEVVENAYRECLALRRRLIT